MREGLGDKSWMSEGLEVEDKSWMREGQGDKSWMREGLGDKSWMKEGLGDKSWMREGLGDVMNEGRTWLWLRQTGANYKQYIM